MDMHFTIVIVDDEEAIRNMTRAMLSRIPYCECLTAPDGHTALKILHTTHCDLMITDICLPDLDGFELARIASKVQNLKIIFISGHAQKPANCQNIFLRKPFPLTELKNLATELINS